jgi:hypothetical protein
MKKWTNIQTNIFQSQRNEGKIIYIYIYIFQKRNLIKIDKKKERKKMQLRMKLRRNIEKRLKLAK